MSSITRYQWVTSGASENLSISLATTDIGAFTAYLSMDLGSEQKKVHYEGKCDVFDYIRHLHNRAHFSGLHYQLRQWQ
jgi:hypothetical protein